MAATPLAEAPCEDLARRAQAGSEVCFEALVERYEARVLGFVLRRCACAADAEDAAQDTFVRAWRMLHKYDPTRRFSPWLFTLAARAAHEANRGASRRARHEAASARLSAAMAAAPADDHEQEGRAAEVRRVWALADRVLSPEQRGILWLRFVEGLSAAETGAALGKSEVGVRVAVFRARQRLAEALASERGDGAPAEARPRLIAETAAAQPVSGGAR